MKKSIFLFVITAISCFNIYSQTVEKSLFSFQTGTFGVWANNELRLNHSIVLRTELGLENIVINKTNFHTSNEFVVFPTISLSPRYYYNLAKRTANGLDILNNSGNFFSINFRFYPEALVISKEKNITSNSYGYLTPMWGIRRNISYHFSYEIGAGYGINLNIGEDGEPNEYQPEIHFRIGYHFF